MKQFLSLFIGLLYCFVGHSQTPILNGLKKQLAIEGDTSKQVALLIKICSRHYSISPDTFLAYINLGEKITSAGTPDFFLLKNFYCMYLSKIGKAGKGLLLTDSVLTKLPPEKEFEQIRFRLMITKCNLLIRNNQSEAALKTSLTLLRMVEEKKDTLLIMQSYILLGYACLEIEKYNEAVNWLNKGCRFTTDEYILKQCGSLFSNNASCFNNLNKMDSAFYFIGLALKYAAMDENLSVQTNALNIRADMYIKLKDYINAERDLKDALALREKAGDIIMLSADMAQLADFYASTSQPGKGIAIAQKGIDLIEPTKNLPKLLFLFYALAQNYKKANRVNEYATTLEKIITIKDMLSAKTSDDAIAEMSAKYELEKKEKIILKQDYDLERNRYLTIAILFLLMSSSFISWLYYKNYKHRQNLKMQKAIAGEKRITLEAITHAEEKERKRIAADLHDNLGSYAAAISSNVKYLKDNFDDSTNAISAQLEENAQNIVTQLSDTIWVLKNEHLQLTQLADRFKLWMQRWMKNYPDIIYYYTETIENDTSYSPEKILHIFLILKECVTNAARHANCKSIKVNFTNNDKLKITIEDDGAGISNINLKGNGIENVKQRAQVSNLVIAWQQALPQGTLVAIESITTN